MLQKFLRLLIQLGSMYRWALVGAITFAIDYIVFLMVFSNINSVYIANFVSGLISVTFNYSSHYKWSFRSKSNHSRAGVKYLFNLILFWTLGTLLLKLLITAGIEAKYAKLSPILLIAPLGFLSLKLFVFKS